MLRRIGRKSRVGIITLGLMAASALVLSGGSGPTAAKSDEGGRAYLALGDSVAFGFIANAGFEYGNANNFVGYPAYVGDALNLVTTNASCPGEATTSFISATGADNGCRPYRAAHLPLHVSYSGTQLAFATAFLNQHRDTKLVTVALGANDAFLLQDACATAANVPLCIQTGLLTLLPQISANMNTILKALRATHFHGILVVVNYYSLDYSNASGTALTVALDNAETAPAAADGALVADAFSAFKTAASIAGGKTCSAGLLNFPGTSAPPCDVHPSQSGQQLLASTVEQVYEAHSE